MMQPSYRSAFLRRMEARGYIHQCSDAAGLDAHAEKESITAYIGFDCTAPSLHAGNLLGLMMLRCLQQTGHRPLVVVGGGTTKIGDPSGRTETRKILSEREIEANIAAISKTCRRFLDFEDKKTGAVMLNNDDWLKDLNYIHFLRETGSHFSVNRMLTMDSVRLRLEREQTLSFLEFNYMILQAYDFYHLHRKHDCILQMGGSDQWGNIINGIELIRRRGGGGAYALTTALLTTTAGEKMGKTARGALWLDGDLCPPYDYWQYWRNIEDADTGRFLRLFTELPPEEIAALEKLQGEALNEAKIILANHACALVHGEAAAKKAGRAAAALFGGGAGGLAHAPAFSLSMSDIEGKGAGLLDIVRRAGLAASNGEARRHIRGQALRLNDMLIEDEAARLTKSAFKDGQALLSLGKKRHVLLRLDGGA